MKLRYFFDVGSGICLWAGDDEARAAYGYPVDLDDLALSPETAELARSLMDRHDCSISWQDGLRPLERSGAPLF